MGRVSKKLRTRLAKMAGRIKRRMATEVGLPPIPKDERDVPELVRKGYDPIHAVYIYAQNVTSTFIENTSNLPELKQYEKVAGAAEDEYMPSGPPMSPLTVSYFTTWAFFDLRFGADKETVGTCLLDLADLLGFDPPVVEAIQGLQESRMGIYEHLGTKGGRSRLRELITDREFVCYCTSGYTGKPGELWYVRLCPPLLDLGDYWITMTTPYVLIQTTKADWVAYLKRAMLEVKAKGVEDKLYHLLKYGLSSNQWNEFVFLAYHHHQHDAVFLAGIPDVRDSLPHA